MRDQTLERDVQAPMQTMLHVVRANGADGANSVLRMIHHLVVLAMFHAPGNRLESLENLRMACLFALGGEEMTVIPRPEVPAYRQGWNQWDPRGLRCNLEAARRVGLRHGAFQDQQVKVWLDYVISTCEQDSRRTA